MQGIAAAAVIAATIGFTQAEEAHEHGVGRLNVALEGQELHLELVSPGANIVGFEHPARSAEDKRAVEEAVVVLRSAENFALPAAAGCTLAAAEVDTELLEEDHGSHGGEEHHEDEERHSGHENDEDGEHDDEGHSDFHAQYRFSCTNPGALDRISVKVFDRFPATEELRVQVIAPKGQTALALTSSNPVLEL